MGRSRFRPGTLDRNHRAEVDLKQLSACTCAQVGVLVLYGLRGRLRSPQNQNTNLRGPLDYLGRRSSPVKFVDMQPDGTESDTCVPAGTGSPVSPPEGRNHTNAAVKGQRGPWSRVKGRNTEPSAAPRTRREQQSRLGRDFQPTRHTCCAFRILAPVVEFRLRSTG